MKLHAGTKVKPAICDRRHILQSGSALLEALIGMILMAIVGLGLSYATAKSLHSQRFLNTQNIFVSSVREWLLTADGQKLARACNGSGQPEITIGDQTATLTVTCETQTVVIGTPSLHISINDDSVWTTINLVAPASATTQAMFGGDGRIQVSL